MEVREAVSTLVEEEDLLRSTGVQMKVLCLPSQDRPEITHHALSDMVQCCTALEYV